MFEKKNYSLVLLKSFTRIRDMGYRVRVKLFKETSAPEGGFNEQNRPNNLWQYFLRQQSSAHIAH